MAASFPASVKSFSAIVDGVTEITATTVNQAYEEIEAIETELKTPSVVVASDTVKGMIEIATIAETSTGTDATRAVSPDGLAGSDFGKQTIEITLLDNDTTLAVVDGIASYYWIVPLKLNGWKITDADAATQGTYSSSGAPTFQIYNLTDTVDILTTAITIDANHYTSYDAATQPVIDTSNNTLATGDRIRFDCDGAGTGTKGCTFILVAEKQ